MKNVTTYYSNRKNVFVWLVSLASLVSIIARLASGSFDSTSFGAMVVHSIFPLAANLLLMLRLPLRCEDMYYVTVEPVVLLAMHFLVRVFELNSGVAITICLLVLLLAQIFAFVLTFTGKVPTKYISLALWVIPFLFLLDGKFDYYLLAYLKIKTAEVVSDISAYFSIVFVILASKKLAERKDGEPYRRKYKDRYIGRRIGKVIPMSKLTAFFMPSRTGACNYISDSVDITAAEKYIHKKRREGLSHFGYTHLFLSAYVRAISEFPALNRYIAGQNIYQRFDIVCSMVIKKDLTIESPETTIKVKLKADDTANEVYEKYDALVQKSKEDESLDSDFDKFAGLIAKIPNVILKFIIWLFKLIDYFGLLLPELEEISPFHASMFITSMGSLGIPPVYHHLYDFGTVSQFCAFGAKRTSRELDKDGNLVSRKYIDYTWTIDERICDGSYYAGAFKKIKWLIQHPDVLDEKPEEVKEDVE